MGSLSINDFTVDLDPNHNPAIAPALAVAALTERFLGRKEGEVLLLSFSVKRRSLFSIGLIFSSFVRLIN
jgi:hypothetical protein